MKRHVGKMITESNVKPQNTVDLIRQLNKWPVVSVCKLAEKDVGYIERSGIYKPQNEAHIIKVYEVAVNGGVVVGANCHYKEQRAVKRTLA